MLLTLELFGFHKATAEYDVSYESNNKGHWSLGLYVDDHIIAGSTDEAMADVKTYLSGSFRMMDIGVVNGRLMGLDITLVRDGITIWLLTYITYMIGAFDFVGCHW